jgi:hypothetical protein
MDKLTELLQQLANKLGTTVEHLWMVLTRQGQIEAVKSMIIFGVAILFAVLYALLLRNKYAILKEEDNDLLGFVFLFTGLGGIIYLSVTACQFVSDIDGLLNPEYWALEHIIKKLK